MRPQNVQQGAQMDWFTKTGGNERKDIEAQFLDFAEWPGHVDMSVWSRSAAVSFRDHIRKHFYNFLFVITVETVWKTGIKICFPVMF